MLTYAWDVARWNGRFPGNLPISFLWLKRDPIKSSWFMNLSPRGRYDVAYMFFLDGDSSREVWWNKSKKTTLRTLEESQVEVEKDSLSPLVEGFQAIVRVTKRQSRCSGMTRRLAIATLKVFSINFAFKISWYLPSPCLQVPQMGDVVLAHVKGPGAEKRFDHWLWRFVA